jgi:hypothetical protein
MLTTTVTGIIMGIRTGMGIVMLTTTVTGTIMAIRTVVAIIITNSWQ